MADLTRQIQAQETEISLHVSEKNRAWEAEKSARDKIKDYETKLVAQQNKYNQLEQAKKGAENALQTKATEIRQIERLANRRKFVVEKKDK